MSGKNKPKVLKWINNSRKIKLLIVVCRIEKQMLMCYVHLSQLYLSIEQLHACNNKKINKNKNGRRYKLMSISIELEHSWYFELAFVTAFVVNQYTDTNECTWTKFDSEVCCALGQNFNTNLELPSKNEGHRHQSANQLIFITSSTNLFTKILLFNPNIRNGRHNNITNYHTEFDCQRVFCWEIDVFAVQWWPNAFVDFLHVLHRNRVDRNRLVLLPNVRLHSTHKHTRKHLLLTNYDLHS